MFPFFPSLTPPIASNLWFDVDIPCDDEAEVTALETEHQGWLNSVQQIGMELHPLGKIPSDLEPVDSDEEDANDDSDDSSHEDEEDEDMEADTIEVERERIDHSPNDGIGQPELTETAELN